MRHGLIVRLGAWFLAASSMGACTGTIGDELAGGGDKSGGVNGNGGNGPGGPSPDTGLWRLTRAELNNTFRDLLGDTTLAANQLPDTPLQGGFDNNAEVLVGHDFDSEAFDRVVATVVENAFLPGTTRSRLLGAAKCTNNTITQACAKTLVSAFARRAWRRPVSSDEIDRLMTGLSLATSLGDNVEGGVKAAFRMALMSQRFLFRFEVDPPDDTGPHPVSPYELATRLSYFIRSSTPDDQLLAAADATGDANLSKPEVFATHLARLLNDPRATDPNGDGLVGNFAGQWLDMRRLEDKASVAPKSMLFDDALRQAMIAEPMSFFAAFLKDDTKEGQKNLTDMLDADFTFANARLAKHYGLTASGTDMKPLTVGGTTHRGGLLTMGGVLTVTSKPE